MGTRDKPVSSHAVLPILHPGRGLGLAPGGILGKGGVKGPGSKPPRAPQPPLLCLPRRQGEGGLRGLCSARSRGLISINKANRLKPWPLLALPPSPPLPLAPDGGDRLVGHPQDPPGEKPLPSTPSSSRGAPGAYSLGEEKMATRP